MAVQLPVFCLDGFERADNHNCPSDVQLTLCHDLAECLERTGILLVQHPLVPAESNDQFLNTMETYFEHAAKVKDARPELCYQVGLTPSGVETPRVLVDPALQQEMAQLAPPHAGTPPQGADVKERFMVRVGPRPAATAFPELNAEPVVPQAFPGWAQMMDEFGSALLGVATSVLRAAALGWGMPANTLVQAMQEGPHLLAPTGSDLAAHGQLGTVLAGYHSDLNLLTVHGQSRFPGLFVWLADGTRAAVRVPPGCLLVQAGQQLEYLTGGRVRAGKHEVVVSEDTRAAVAAARASGRSLWRVSSTLFAHCASDFILRPLLGLAAAGQDAGCLYPPIAAGLQVQWELEAISLKAPSSAAGSGSGMTRGSSARAGEVALEPAGADAALEAAVATQPVLQHWQQEQQEAECNTSQAPRGMQGSEQLATCSGPVLAQPAVMQASQQPSITVAAATKGGVGASEGSAGSGAAGVRCAHIGVQAF